MNLYFITGSGSDSIVTCAVRAETIDEALKLAVLSHSEDLMGTELGKRWTVVPLDPEALGGAAVITAITYSG